MSNPQSSASANESDSSVASQIDQNSLARFRETVIEYITLPAKMEELKEPLKAMKDRYKAAEKEILDFMRTQNIETCNIPESIDGGGLLVPKVSITKGTAKKDNWTEGFNSWCRKRGYGGEGFEDLEKEVKSCCPQVSKTTLKRVKKQ
jgi:hypothetical protein